MNQIFRYSSTWQWIGFLAVFLAVVFPLLMYWNNETFDLAVVAGLIGMAVAGVWCVLYLRRYELVLGEEGFVVRRLWRAQFSATWPEIVSVRAPLGAQEVELEKSDGGRIKVSVYFPGLQPLLDEAKCQLPPSAWKKQDR